ncbi:MULTISPECIES: hypothetical protein [Clostridia]|uniref:hypothetical protein n=1 Tax=Clostridia TaxID=186801 RepID=UPI00067F5A7F|nr:MULTISPECIES: hypothetical protein [Clostridia]
MNNHITYKQAAAMLNSQKQDYHVLNLGGGWRSIITRYGGRLLGPFKEEDGESILWITPAMKDELSFKKFIESRQAQLGGERFWVNPELHFYCESPETFDDTYTVQPEIDPGHYILEKQGDNVILSQQTCLRDLNDGTEKHFFIKRRYSSARNPLEYIKAIKSLEVDFCGFVQDIELRNETPDGKTYLEPWVLTQVNPEGRFVTPFFGDFEFVDYYTPVEEMQRVCKGYAELDVTGNRKYKVAYRSAQTFGRMAFVKRWGNGWHLMVRNYYNDPSTPYCSEPWGDLGNRGCSVYYYNDDLSNGGFAEFESGGLTLGGDANRQISHNTTSLWFFFGGKEEIEKIMRYLLGINYNFTG